MEVQVQADPVPAGIHQIGEFESWSNGSFFELGTESTCASESLTGGNEERLRHSTREPGGVRDLRISFEEALPAQKLDSTSLLF